MNMFLLKNVALHYILTNASECKISLKSVPIKKQTHLHLGWPEGESISANFHFLMNYSLKTTHVCTSDLNLLLTCSKAIKYPVLPQHRVAVCADENTSLCIPEDIVLFQQP